MAPIVAENPEASMAPPSHNARIAADPQGDMGMTGEFQGKIVVVSGASRGIGRAIAIDFAREGALCVLAASSAANLAAAAKTIVHAGGAEPMTVAADLRTLAGCQQVFEQVDKRFNRCDALINCAGATQIGRAHV